MPMTVLELQQRLKALKDSGFLVVGEEAKPTGPEQAASLTASLFTMENISSVRTLLTMKQMNLSALLPAATSSSGTILKPNCEKRTSSKASPSDRHLSSTGKR